MKLNAKDEVDLPRLIKTRLLVQANSGGGKSWLLRRILEQTHGKVQQIVIDPEGEFGSLREKYDYVLAGKGGDIAAEPRTAALLARRLLETRASAIIDLYELPPQERKRFVRLFIDAMMNAPKELYHEVLVVLDEAHIFVPEKEQSEAASAVIDLCTRGRKRGFCAVLATQRISKLAKDAAAECNNKLIGRTSLDIDIKRAGEELGFTSKEELRSLRTLKPGEFFAFGPAIADEVRQVKIGEVHTDHPDVGSKSVSHIPPPTAAIKRMLDQFKDLPAEAEEEARTIAELKQENARLKRDITNIKKSVTIQPDDNAVRAAVLAKEKQMAGERKTYEVQIAEREKKLAQIAKVLGSSAPVISYEPPRIEIQVPAHRATSSPSVVPSTGLSGPEQRILNAIAWFESIGIGEPEQTAVAFLAGYTYGGGGFNNPRGALRTRGLVEYRGTCIALTDSGRESAQEPQSAPSQQELHEKVLAILPGPEQRLLRPLLASYPEDMSNEDLAAASGYQAGSGGFNNPKGRLRSLGLVDYPTSGRVRARDLLFP